MTEIRSFLDDLWKDLAGIVEKDPHCGSFSDPQRLSQNILKDCHGRFSREFIEGMFWRIAMGNFRYGKVKPWFNYASIVGDYCKRYLASDCEDIEQLLDAANALMLEYVRRRGAGTELKCSDDKEHYSI